MTYRTYYKQQVRTHSLLVDILSPRKPFVESLNYLVTEAYIILMMTSVFLAIISVL
jgi:hypothetical protein